MKKRCTTVIFYSYEENKVKSNEYLLFFEKCDFFRGT